MSKMGPVRAVPVRAVPVHAVPVRAVRMWNPLHAGSGSTFRGSRRSGSVRGFTGKRRGRESSLDSPNTANGHLPVQRVTAHAL